MAVRYKITKEEFDALSPEMQKEYNAKDSHYILDLAGIDLSGATKYESERDKRRAAEKKAKDAEDALETFKEGDDRATMLERHNRDLKKEKERGDKAEERAKGLSRKYELESAADKLSEKLNPKLAKVMRPHVMARLDMDYTDPDAPKLVVLDKDGKASTATTDDLYKEFVANKDFAGIVVTSQATGGVPPRTDVPRDRGNPGPLGNLSPPPRGNDAGAARPFSQMGGKDLLATIEARGGPLRRQSQEPG